MVSFWRIVSACRRHRVRHSVPAPPRALAKRQTRHTRRASAGTHRLVRLNVCYMDAVRLWLFDDVGMLQIRVAQALRGVANS